MKALFVVFFGIILLSQSYFMSYGEEDIPFPQQWGGTGASQAIPEWVDNSFRWYVDDLISQEELLTSVN